MCLQFAEGEVERMRTSYELHTLSQRPPNLESIYNSLVFDKEKRHNGFFPGSFSSLETTTDGERTSNSGSDTPQGELIPFKALSMSTDEQTWRMRSAESCSGYNPELKLSSDEEMEHASMDDMKESTNEDLENSLGKDIDSVQSKLCPRGHWRPAEDEKLRELVSQYGPQNWNLIAEKLQGRSGIDIIVFIVQVVL